MRNCSNCKYCDKCITEEPCMDCIYAEYWEPKEIKVDEYPGSDSKS